MAGPVVAQDLFARVVQATPVGLVVVDGDLRLVSANPAAVALSPKVSAFIGQSAARYLAEVLPAGTADALLAQVAAVLRGGDPLRLPLWKLTTPAPDGSERYMDCEVRRIELGDGRPGLLITGVEATNRAVIQSELEEARDRFRLLAEAGPQLVWIAGTDGKLRWASAQYLAFVGASSIEELRASGWREVFHPDEYDTVFDVWGRSVQSGQAFALEMRMRRADGTWRWQLCRAQPHRDQDGRIVQWLGSVTDIDDLKRSELARRESDRRFRTLADQIPALVWEADVDNRCTWVNRRWTDYSGRELEQELGFGWADLVHPDDCERAVSYCNAHVERRAPFTMEFRLRRHDGAYRWFQDVAVPRFDDGGAFVGYIGACLDIDAQRAVREREHRHQAELERINGELLRANADLEQFVYLASHDLQEPLRMVALYLELLSRQLGPRLDDRLQNWLQSAVEGAIRMRDLIDGLLALTRSARGPAEGEDRCAASEALTAALDNLRLRIAESAAEIDAQPLPSVAVPRSALSQLFQNLIGNALKFVAPDVRPKVAIAAFDGGGGWYRFEIADNGIGIEAQYRDRVFEVFQRLHQRSAYPGTGIGLAVCRRIVERHGGRIWIEDGLDGGSRFCFTLPVA